MQEDNAIAVNVKAVSQDAAQYLTFLLGGKSYGIQILSIREIIQYEELTEMPMMPAFIAGVINLRGRVVPIIDLGQRFAKTKTAIAKRTSIIILEIGNEDLLLELGIIVDMVNDVLSLSEQDIEPPPKLGEQISTQFISGMAKTDDKLLILLDIKNIFSVDELALVGNIPEQA